MRISDWSSDVCSSDLQVRRKRRPVSDDALLPQRPHQHADARDEGRIAMSGLSIFDISGRAMSAQLVRLNTTASNLAHAGSIAKSEAEVYRARKPVFETVSDETTGGPNATASGRTSGRDRVGSYGEVEVVTDDAK